jgi:3-dehydroquinate synthetase
MISESLSIPGFHTEIHFVSDLTTILNDIGVRFPSSRYLLITDPIILSLYEGAISISDIAKKVNIKTLPCGELNKNIENFQIFQDYLLSNGFLRNDLIISLGGGLVGDFAGFVASSFMRGVRFVQIPTSLLAMVDASIGSKTGVNTRYGKNLLGSFYDPVAVYVNTRFLSTLDNRNFCNGMAEIIKAALIADSKLFVTLLENTEESLRQGDMKLLQGIIKRSMEIKISIVKDDRKEADRRALLNFGHTVGHGIEAASQVSKFL